MGSALHGWKWLGIALIPILHPRVDSQLNMDSLPPTWFVFHASAAYISYIGNSVSSHTYVNMYIYIVDTNYT